MVLGVWKDKAAFDSHMASAPSKQLGEKLQPLFASPNDERQHNVLTVADGKAAARGAIFVVTHVDVPPPRKDECIVALKALTADSRKEANAVRFEIFQQSSRPNHFTVVEVWKGDKAYETHITAPHTIKFRDTLTPMSGALYDERTYKAL